jgi:hypothetical protein
MTSSGGVGGERQKSAVPRNVIDEWAGAFSPQSKRPGTSLAVVARAKMTDRLKARYANGALKVC